MLGGCGAWPAAGLACSGYLVEHEDFRLLVDPGYATLPRLLGYRAARDIDAVLVSHGHPDHCADLNPLLAEATSVDPLPPDDAPYLSDAGQAGRLATEAGAARLMLTHLWPGTDPAAARVAAARGFTGPIDVALPGVVVEPG